MNRFEDELRSALARREPPAGFADRVMARIPGKRESRLSRTWLSAAAAVLMTVLGAGSWEYMQVRQRRTEAEQAKTELIQAMKVTSSKLQAARAKLLRQTGGLI